MRLEFSELKLPPIVNRVTGPQYEEFKRTLLGLMFTQRTRVFDNEEGPDGTWERLKTRQESVRFKKLPGKVQRALLSPEVAFIAGEAKILQDNRLLVQSMTIQGASLQETSTSGDEISLGSNVEYSAIHNFGGTIKHPGTQNGFGRGITIEPYDIDMPQRQFDHFTSQDLEEIEELARSYLNEPEGAFA